MLIYQVSISAHPLSKHISVIWTRWNFRSKDDQLDSAAEKKKEKKKAPSKHSEDVEFYEDEDEVQAKVIEAGSESPRTLALRAMGAHAANVIDIMQKKDGYEGRRGSDSMSQLSMDLPAIREENSDFEHSGNHSIPAVVIDVSEFLTF